MSNVQLLEVVGRGRETQLQVGENFNDIPSRIKVPHNVTTTI